MAWNERDKISAEKLVDEIRDICGIKMTINYDNELIYDPHGLGYELWQLSQIFVFLSNNEKELFNSNEL